jgi:hypothetical protein
MRQVMCASPFDASFQQILRSELEILWEARSTPTLAGGHVSRQISFKISIQC